MVLFIILKLVITMCYGSALYYSKIIFYKPGLGEAADNHEDEVREDGKRKTEGDSESRD